MAVNEVVTHALVERSTETIAMATTPAARRRLRNFTIQLGEPFIIASREDDPDGGTFVYPRLWRGGDAIFVNWHFDRDVLDGRLPTRPHGRVSRDGGRTWERQAALSPPGYKAQTGPHEVTSYWHAFEVPGSPGHYRMATWHSADNGESWSEMTWTPIAFPGTRGMDIYNPPDGYRHHSANYKGKSQRPAPPPYLISLYEQAGTPRRGPQFHHIHRDHAGTLCALSVARWLPDGEGITNEQEFWGKLDWSRNAIVAHHSADQGRSWTYDGVVAFDKDHDITEFDEESCFAEPAMAIYPDGHCVCIMRTGSLRPLYLVRSSDGGRTWSKPRAMPIRGVDPHLALLPCGVLVLATGRPDCTVHFSLDRGETWPVNEVLFTGDRTYAAIEDRYTGSTCNPGLTIVDDRTLLYIHDVSRHDPRGEDQWLKRAGHTRVIGRFIHVDRTFRAACASTLTDCLKPLMRWRTRQPCEGGDAAMPTVHAVRRSEADVDLADLLNDRFWTGQPAYPLVDVEKRDAMIAKAWFHAAWAGDALLLAIRCDEPDMARLQQQAGPEDADAFWGGDIIELQLRTQVHSYYQIAMNAAGTHVDIDRANGLDLRWRSQVQVAARRGDNQWRLAVRLPIAPGEPARLDPLHGIAGSPPTVDAPWFINVCRQRVLAARREMSAFVPMGNLGFHQPLRLGRLHITEATGSVHH